jgi:hypothetical protein
VVLGGAVVSVALLLRATSRNPSPLLVVLLAIWVASPFVVLLVASLVSPRWSPPTRRALSIVMLVVTLSTLAIYVADAVWPRASQGAFDFIVVPPASWLVIALVVLPVVFTSRRSQRRTR